MTDGGLAVDLRIRDGAAPSAQPSLDCALQDEIRSLTSFPPEFTALAAAGLPLDPLLLALGEAAGSGVAPFDALLASGAFGEADLVRTLARALGVEALGGDADPGGPIDAETFSFACRTGVLRFDGADGRARTLLAARGRHVGGLAAARRGRPSNGSPFVIAGPQAFADILLRKAGPALAARATLGPGVVAPELTVAGGAPAIGARDRWILLAVATAVATAVVFDETTRGALFLVTGVMFLVMNAFRLLLALARPPERPRVPRGDDARLPVYTVLVPLVREAAVISSLLDALEALDYPRPKLDVKLLIEEGDRETLDALARRPPRPGIEVLVLPAGGPKTKPRALNAGLLAARGVLLTVFDAEDRPDPDQLRRADHAFRSGPPTLACVQAQLAPDNLEDGWLARQFAIEYAALFDVALPALAARGLPLPLGGTSNHFRVSTLRALGGWDAGNVTEDADLGLRLARNGWTTGVIVSTTSEEAPIRLTPWLKQRTRWMKGYMITALVHGRHMGDLYRRLGLPAFLASQLVIGGVALTALAYPVAVAAFLASGFTGQLFAAPAGWGGVALGGVHVANLFIGYAAGLAVAWIGIDRRGLAGCARLLFSTPLYWLLVGAAAWRALGQIIFGSATHWEKTAHGLSTRRRTPAQR